MDFYCVGPYSREILSIEDFFIIKFKFKTLVKEVAVSSNNQWAEKYNEELLIKEFEILIFLNKTDLRIKSTDT